MGREFELKFRCEAEVLQRIEEDYGEFTPLTMKTTYYDTFDGKLSNARWTLRRREENGVCVCTVKIPEGEIARGEWEVECSSIMAAIPALCKLGAPIRLMEFCVNGVGPLCGAAFTRLARTVELSDGTCELALDRGVLVANGRETAFAEAEVEAKTCSDEAAAAFAASLAEKYTLTPESRSKFYRAMILARGGEV